MTKKRLLEEAIIKITKQAGLETTGTFHLTSVSHDSSGLFIMEVMRPARKRLCEEVKRVVTGFPSDTESGCIALLPEVADEIILAAQSDPADVLPASGRTAAGETLVELHPSEGKNLGRM
jgi:hypothetical protein